MFEGLKGMGDLMQVMRRLPQMQEDAKQAAERARNRRVTGESGAGLVKVTATGLGEVVSCEIDPEVLKNPETVGPLVVAATNVALQKAKDVLREEAKQVTGMDLPPGLF